MKKIFALMLCLALALSLFGCGKETVREDIADTAYSLTAVISEINGATMIVDSDKGRLEVPMEKIPSSPELQVGDTIEVIYYGTILETNPGRFEHIISVEVIREVISVESEEPGAGSYMITIGKTTEDVNAGTYMLSESETAKVMTAIALSVDENGWVNDDLTVSAISFKVLIRDLFGISIYNYSADVGVFNDLENIRSLKLTDEARNTVNTIFENYVSMAADEG